MKGSSLNHIIHKQTLDIQFSDFDTAHKWIASTQASTAEAMRRSIEYCFEDYDYTNDYLTIEKLELDLGIFGADELLSKMPGKLYSELQKILRSYHVEMNHFEEAEIITNAAGKNKRMPIVKNSEVDAFLYFLQHGYLPWWYSNEPAWDLEWVQKFTEENWKGLRNLLTVYQENEVYHERILIRLISQFSDGFLANFLNGLQLKERVEEAWNWLARFYMTMQKTGSDFHYAGSLPSLSVLRLHFWKKWVGYALDKSTIPELTTLFMPIMQTSSIASLLLVIVESNEWMDNIPEFWRSELLNFKRGEYGKLDSDVNVEDAKNAERKKSEDAGKEKSIAEDDFILIPDAGLILLHPFLPRLLEDRGWLRENEFVNDEARNSAVYLLHYLASVDEDAPEYVLMLPKLLCGIALEWPLEPAPPLTDAEKAACDELLVQVIGHWSALRNTSPSTLRETFLRREGKLRSTDEGWRLEVQRKTEDILLNRMPWGFSMIKFSWMPRLLSVNWE
jgi:hypothetical protein